MGWQEDMALRDLDEATLIEARCLKCQHTWLESPARLLRQAAHPDVRLNEVAEDLACARPGCRHVGAQVMLIQNEDTSGFVGGMP